MGFIKNKLLTIVLVLCLAFTVFIGITANKKENTGVLQGAVSYALNPVQKYVYAAGQRIGNMFYFMTSILSTQKENSQLKAQVGQLEQQLVDYNNFKRQNDELNKLLAFKNQRTDLKLIGANVIGKTGENWFNVILLDVGEANGVKKGQYVVNSQGLVGQIIETTQNSSKVATILDNTINIPAEVSSTGENGIVSGSSSNNTDKTCKMSNLSIDTKAQVNDPVVTSNILQNENIYVPANITIGYIESISDEQPNLEKAAIIKPAVDFSNIEKVFVITR